MFSSIVDSSLWDEPLHVRVLFLTMLAVKDWDYVVRVQDHHLRRKANLSSDRELLDGLKILSSPDTRSSIPQPFDGRRILRVEDGWLILNGEKYQKAMQEANKRARWARNKREQRAREAIRKKELNGELASAEPAFARAETEAEQERVLDEHAEAKKIHNQQRKRHARRPIQIQPGTSAHPED